MKNKKCFFLHIILIHKRKFRDYVTKVPHKVLMNNLSMRNVRI